MVEPSDAGARRAAILQAAIGVFLRYGFRKASMDDLARAAGLSRQGLYLHFATKEALFKEMALEVVGAMRAAVRGALDRDEAAIEDRLLAAFEAKHGTSTHRAGGEHMNELLETAATLLGPVVDDLERGIAADLARTLRAEGVAARWKDAGVSAKELADHLVTASRGAAQAAGDAEYRERMKVAIRIVCRGGH